MPRWCSSMRPPQDDGAAQDRQPLAPPGPLWSEERVNPAYAAVCRSRFRVSRRRAPQALSRAAVGPALGSHRPRPPRRARQWRGGLIRDEHPLAIADIGPIAFSATHSLVRESLTPGQSYARAAAGRRRERDRTAPSDASGRRWFGGSAHCSFTARERWSLGGAVRRALFHECCFEALARSGALRASRGDDDLSLGVSFSLVGQKTSGTSLKV